MTKREKKRYLKILDKTEALWRSAKWVGFDDYFALMPPSGEDVASECPLCVSSRNERIQEQDNCSKCLVAISGIAHDIKDTETPCADILDRVYEQRNKRPAYRAINRMRKWVEKQ